MEEEDIPQFGLRPARRNPRPLTRREVEMMLRDHSPAQILQRITREDGSLNNLLSNVVIDAGLVIKVLCKALTGTERSQRQATTDVVNAFVHHPEFLDRLEKTLQFRGSDFGLVKAVLILMRTSLYKLPHQASRALYFAFHTRIQPMAATALGDVELRALMTDVTDLITASSRQAERFDEVERNREMRQHDFEVEPGQFRGLSIFPTEDDFDAQRDIQVRANKIRGEYDNINDYLDIQFRLLRADLILPLRDSILEYQAQGADEYKHYFASIKVYSHVRIVRPICHDKGLCFRLSFDVSNSRINWAVSQRLKYGSLLCLSADNFQTYRCAVVENREPQDLKKGLIDVQFIFQAEGQRDQMGRHEEFMTLLEEGRDVRYVMVESPSYFEAYKYVLQGLQNITEENFPFWRYIGQCCGQVDPPRYLLDHGDGATMDLRPLIDTDYTLRDQPNADGVFSENAQIASAVVVGRPETWPHRNVFNLDISQFVALQSALTREFALIQGPPGTGKTFIGLLAMRALLHNKTLWIGDEPTPILLVCYTNHALDQFLEGILEFFDGKLVRVGSRSKSEKLEDYNLRSLRHRAHAGREVPIEIHLGKVEVRTKLKSAKADIHLEAAKLEMLEREIVCMDFLKEFISPEHVDSLQRRHSENYMADFLGITSEIKKIEKEGLKRKAKNFQGDEARGGPGEQGNVDAEEQEGDEEELEDDDINLFEEATNEALRNRYLDIDEDDEDIVEDDFDLFAELAVNERFENVRRVNQRLDEVDREVTVMRRLQIAFNISDFGEETEPFKLSKKEKELRRQTKVLKRQYKLLLLDHLQKTEKMAEEAVLRVVNVWSLKRRERWQLYMYWVDLYCRQLRGAIRDKSQEYERLARRYQEILHQEDKFILEKSTIIGMTTTGAARYQEVLREIGPKIIMVEEAAEVLEGHVITSLSAQSQHVILIGDHKQLRPNPSVYKLKTQYGIDISLFERLVGNTFPMDVLKYQHRMRPEISQFMKIPDLYPDLQDHDSVKHYPHVLKVNGDVRFIHHEETEESEADMKTFINRHEALFVLSLLQYLVKQGYAANRISILSPYAGQIHHIRNLIEQEVEASMKRMMKGIKVASVDNYQGQENDIIILSLVRSNEDNVIGFLKVNNRLCVALSRAKIGLYVIGDLHGLSNSSPMFREIVMRANNNGYVDNHMELLCTQHRGKRTVVRESRDFRKVPEGGCNLPCDVRLACGHTCERTCHADDESHTEVVCRQECRSICETCGQPCRGGHKCGFHTKCTNLVEKVLPVCNHKQMVPCAVPANQFECKADCIDQLPCGHRCPKKCGERHQHQQELCNVTVEVHSDVCGHTYKIHCGKSKRPAEDTCSEPCGAILPCDHVCSGTCGQCLNGRLHVNCREPCKKLLICGHECEAECSDCPPCRRPCENACIHSRCPKVCGQPCASCLESCDWSCKHTTCQDLCCQPCARDVCNIPCPKRLPCGHNCAGLCGEKCPKLCTICDKEELMEMNGTLTGYDGDPTTLFIELDCGHVIDVDFVDQWIKTSTQADEEEGQRVIGMVTCPSCKSPVRKCNRYNKQIKEILQLIERVKRKYIGEKKKVEDLQKQRDRIAHGLLGQDRQDIDTFLTKGPSVLSVSIIEAQINQIQLYRQLCALSRMASEGETRWSNRGATFRKIQSDLTHFKTWALKVRSLFSDQNKTDAMREHGRLKALLTLHTYNLNIDTQGIVNDIPQSLMTQLGLSIKALSVNTPVSETDIDQGMQLCAELKELVPTSHIALTAEEKLQIVQAMNVQKGSWYKCRRGHIYAIGECGQAMELAKCPECQVTIGGTNHALDPSNAWAPEMDNAEVPIWNNLAADRQLAEQLQRELEAEGFL